jgi:hypothetical protein
MANDVRKGEIVVWGVPEGGFSCEEELQVVRLG